MYYARVLPPIPVCIGFWDKNLRDKWVTEQNRKDLERHNARLQEWGVSEKDCPWEERFKAISAKEALKRFGERDAWGVRKVRTHRVLTAINDKW